MEQILFAPYLRNAFLFLLCLSIVGAAISVLVNLRRMEFTVEALVHSVFPGIVVGLIVGGIPGIVPGAAAVATVTVLVWTRPWLSVTGMRWTRWTPDSNFSWAYGASPLTPNTTSL